MDSLPQVRRIALGRWCREWTDVIQVNQNETFQQLYAEAKANHTGIFACEASVC